MEKLLEIHIAKISESGLHICGQTEEDILGLPHDGRLLEVSPAQVDLVVTKLGEDVIARGEAGVRLKCQCDRCLTEFTQDIFAEDIVAVVDKAPDVLDLTEWVREDILINFPRLYLCTPGCKGLCLTCGRNLNDGSCDCHSPIQSGPLAAALEGLKIAEPKKRSTKKN